MPELTEESTPPTVSTPPAPEPSADPPEAPPAIPPIIDPDRFEDFPVLREIFLLYVSDPDANASLRGAAELLYHLILNYWGEWPDQPEAEDVGNPAGPQVGEAQLDPVADRAAAGGLLLDRWARQRAEAGAVGDE